mmetsp:Transcript_29465/g.54668  ORF Transcript_29465/g.54668 Transcript_29465/m.54668 type:complete len:141 (-) Transcript_29465:852-1274(-)
MDINFFLSNRPNPRREPTRRDNLCFPFCSCSSGRRQKGVAEIDLLCMNDARKLTTSVAADATDKHLGYVCVTESWRRSAHFSLAPSQVQHLALVLVPQRRSNNDHSSGSTFFNEIGINKYYCFTRPYSFNEKVNVSSQRR